MSDDPTLTSPLRPGDPVLLRWRKWDGSPHWLHECVYLGSDEHGDWIGQQNAWECSRPGREYVTDGANVMVVPPSGEWLAMVNAAPHTVRVYIDVAWDVRWADAAQRAHADVAEVIGVDMDLDVVRPVRGETFIDDEDEFAEHRVRFGYPLDVAERVEAVAAELLPRVAGFEVPFDDATAARWFAVLAGMTAEWPGRR